MYQIDFYEKRNGISDVWDFLEELRLKSGSNKDARIQYEQIIFYLDLLARNGTNLPSKITKHLEDGIWELRLENLPALKRHERITSVNKRSDRNEDMGRLQESCEIHRRRKS